MFDDLSRLNSRFNHATAGFRGAIDLTSTKNSSENIDDMESHHSHNKMNLTSNLNRMRGCIMQVNTIPQALV